MSAKPMPVLMATAILQESRIVQNRLIWMPCRPGKPYCSVTFHENMRLIMGRPEQWCLITAATCTVTNNANTALASR